MTSAASKESLLFDDEPKVRAYRALLTSSGSTVHTLKPLHVLYKRNKELLFAICEVDATTTDGRKLLPYVVIRGDACVIVPLIRNKATGEERFLMIRQYRTGNGRWSLEFPAGMLDRNINDPTSVARNELHEETGLDIEREKLFPLCDRPLFTSVGLQDEAIFFYGCIVELDDDVWQKLEGSTAGEESEGEYIKVSLIGRAEAEKETDSIQVLMGFALFEKARLK